MAKAKTLYQAVCLVCYRCIIKTGSKKDCEFECTSHGNLYGHQTTLQPVKAEA